MAQEFVFTSSLPPVSLDAATPEAIDAEVGAMRDDVETVPALADIIADAEELRAARADIAELAARGYAVTEALVDRVELLARLALEANADRSFDRVNATPAQRQQMEAARVRLLAIRSHLAALGSAAGLPPQLMMLGTTRSNRLNVVLVRMDEILRNTERVVDQLPDRDTARRLLAEGKALVQAQYDLRRDLGLARRQQVGGTQRHLRLQRLLLDTLIYLSRQGRAAFLDAPDRAQKYLLDHIYGGRPSRVADPGTTPQPPTVDAEPAPTA